MNSPDGGGATWRGMIYVVVGGWMWLCLVVVLELREYHKNGLRIVNVKLQHEKNSSRSYIAKRGYSQTM